MPVITISAVNAGTDTLTATAHGLLTGDRFRVRNSTGGALPTGLTGATDVFAIRQDADSLKVATSNANALAGTPVIDITGAGSGTNLIEYGLPYCIPTALAAAGTQIKSANDQGSWNSLVALYDLLTGQAQSVFSGVTLAVPLTVPLRTMIVPLSAPVTNTSGITAQPVTINAASPTFWVGQIDGLLVGETIAAIRLRCKDSATGPTKVQAHLTIGTDGAVGAPTSNSNVSDGSGNAQYVTMSPALVVAVGNVYIVSANLTTGTQNCSLYHLEVDLTGPVG